MKWETLKALRALRDDTRAPKGERDAAAEMLRRRLAAAGIDESALDVEQADVHTFLVGRGDAQKLFNLIGCILLNQNPLMIECIYERRAPALNEWKIKVTAAQAIDLNDCYGHYQSILSAEREKLAELRKAITKQLAKEIREAEKSATRQRKEVALTEKQLLLALANKFQLISPKSPKQRKSEPLTPSEMAATLANMADMDGEPWARKLSGDPQRQLGNGQLQLEFQA